MQMTRRNMFKFGAASAATLALSRAQAEVKPPEAGVSFASVKESLRFTMPSYKDACRFMVVGDSRRSTKGRTR